MLVRYSLLETVCRAKAIANLDYAIATIQINISWFFSLATFIAGVFVLICFSSWDSGSVYTSFRQL